MEVTTWLEAKELIQKWLTEGGHSVEEQKDDNANFHFVIDVPPKSSYKQSVVQPKQAPDTVLIVKPVGISPEHINAMRKMEQKARDRLVWSILKGLIFNENEYQMEKDQEGIPKRVVFTYELPFDELTKIKLRRAISLNYRSFIYLVGELRNGIEGMPTVDPSEIYG